MFSHYDSGDYDLSGITTQNVHWKYSPLTAMLIFLVKTIFYIDIFSDYNLKMNKLGGWLTFPSQ